MNYTPELYEFNFQELKDELKVKLDENATLDMKINNIKNLLEAILEKQITEPKSSNSPTAA